MIAVILRFTGEGEVFYYQIRVGNGGRRFRLIKFATMRMNSPNEGAGHLTLPDDPRVLPVGYFLRKSKINELPQLLNVIIGDMSLVGPRPQVPEVFDQYCVSHREKILQVKPGLSGVASVVFRDEETLLSLVPDPSYVDEKLIMPYKGAVESWYVEKRGLKLYFVVIYATVVHLAFPGSIKFSQKFSDFPNPDKRLAKLLKNW